jgi:amidase
VRTRVLAAFDHADVLAMPTVQLPPFPIDWDWPREVAGEPQGHYLTWMRSCWYITLTGLPAISVPCGFTGDGLPVGIQLVGRPYGELELLRVAASFELANPVGARRPEL